MDAESLVRALANSKTRKEIDQESENSPFPRWPRELEFSIDSLVLDRFILFARVVVNSK